MASEGRADVVIRADGLAKRFGTLEAVRGVSFEVRRGECFGLLGPNGAGKTTTVRMLHAFTPITGGSVEVFGHDVRTEGRAVRSLTGVCPQEDNLDPDFTVRKNLLVYARYYDITGAEARRRADGLLDFVGLAHRAADRIQTLSGGMKRRLVLARSLMNQPSLLVLDEPTTGLDPQARHQIWERVHRLKGEGTTILLTTHYMEEAERLCDRLVLMDEGRIVVQGTPAELVAAHAGHDVVEVWRPDPRLGAAFRDIGREVEELDGRLIVYTPSGEEDLTRARELSRVEPERCILRKADLEDVFLRLTGRSFRD